MTALVDREWSPRLTSPVVELELVLRLVTGVPVRAEDHDEEHDVPRNSPTPISSLRPCGSSHDRPALARERRAQQTEDEARR